MLPNLTLHSAYSHEWHLHYGSLLKFFTILGRCKERIQHSVKEGILKPVRKQFTPSKSCFFFLLRKNTISRMFALLYEQFTINDNHLHCFKQTCKCCRYQEACFGYKMLHKRALCLIESLDILDQEHVVMFGNISLNFIRLGIEIWLGKRVKSLNQEKNRQIQKK
jgi:hypothetical protein